MHTGGFLVVIRSLLNLQQIFQWTCPSGALALEAVSVYSAPSRICIAGTCKADRCTLVQRTDDNGVHVCKRIGFFLGCLGYNSKYRLFMVACRGHR